MANLVTRNSSHNFAAEFQKRKAVHISINNSDGRQQILTRAHTSHYTNKTVDIDSGETEAEQIQDERRAFDEEVYVTFKIREKVSPPSIIYEHKKDDDLLRWCLNRGLAWVLTSAVGQQVSNAERFEPLGFWTSFMKQVIRLKTKKAVLEYLPVVPLPLGDNICKWYLDKMTEMVGDLENECIFLRADVAVYSKMMISSG